MSALEQMQEAQKLPQASSFLQCHHPHCLPHRQKHGKKMGKLPRCFGSMGKFFLRGEGIVGRISFWPLTRSFPSPGLSAVPTSKTTSVTAEFNKLPLLNASQ